MIPVACMHKLSCCHAHMSLHATQCVDSQKCVTRSRSAVTFSKTNLKSVSVRTFHAKLWSFMHSVWQDCLHVGLK